MGKNPVVSSSSWLHVSTDNAASLLMSCDIYMLRF